MTLRKNPHSTFYKSRKNRMIAVNSKTYFLKSLHFENFKNSRMKWITRIPKPLSAKCIIQAYGSGLYLRGYQTVKTPEDGKSSRKPLQIEGSHGKSLWNKQICLRQTRKIRVEPGESADHSNRYQKTAD